MLPESELRFDRWMFCVYVCRTQIKKIKVGRLLDSRNISVPLTRSNISCGRSFAGSGIRYITGNHFYNYSVLAKNKVSKTIISTQAGLILFI